VTPEPRNALKAVVYGILVDVGGSLAAGLALAIAYAIVLAASGTPAEEVQRAVSDPAPASWLSILGFLVGVGASFLGGYVCARVAGAAEMKWVGIVASVSGVTSLLMGTGAYAFEWNALFALLGMGAVFAGGWIGARRNARPAV
jgi:hypothetical protein